MATITGKYIVFIRLKFIMVILIITSSYMNDIKIAFNNFFKVDWNFAKCKLVIIEKIRVKIFIFLIFLILMVSLLAAPHKILYKKIISFLSLFTLFCK